MLSRIGRRPNKTIKIFFPTRHWVPLDNDDPDQINQPSLCQPNESDVAKLKEFAMLAEREGCDLDPSTLRFVCVTQLHPDDDPRGVSHDKVHGNDH